jgi:hypothetical protein
MKLQQELTTRRLRWAAAGLFIFLPQLCHAQSRCPWINKATASGILGGPATVSVDNKKPDSTVCKFHFEKDNHVYDLQIDVEQMKDANTEFVSYKSRCGAEATSLRGIGNEAQACSADKGATHAEQVIGRVRDRAFVVILSTDDSSMPRDVLKEKARSDAEQVAGILF